MKKWLVVIILFSGVIAVSISQYRSILTAYAEFFTVNNATPGADVIVVLSGSKNSRIPHAFVSTIPDSDKIAFIRTSCNSVGIFSSS